MAHIRKRRYPSGRWHYQVRWDDPETGKQKAKTGFRTRREAEEWYAEHVFAKKAPLEVLNAGDHNRRRRYNTRDQSSRFVQGFDVPGIYFVQTTVMNPALTKIGLSKRILQRFDMLAANSPFELKIVKMIPCHENDLAELERILHETFADFRFNGEWFALPKGWERHPVVRSLERKHSEEG